MVRKLMAKKPEDRYQTPAEVAAALASGLALAVTMPAERNDRTIADGGTSRRLRPAGRHARLCLRIHWTQRDHGGGGLAASPGSREAEDDRWLLSAWRAVHLSWLAWLSSLAALAAFCQKTDRQKPRKIVRLLPGTPPKSPAKVDDAWLKQVAAMPAEKQVEAVAAKLKELNPGFDGKVTHKIEDGVVTELQFVTDNVTDISPVRALAGLQDSDCAAALRGKGTACPTCRR